MYTVYVSLQALQMSSTLLTKEIVRIQTSLCWPTNSFLANYGCTYVTTIFKHLYIAGLTLYLVISINSSRLKLAKISCKGSAIVAELFVWAQFPHCQGEPLCYDQGRADQKRMAYRTVSD